MLASLVLVLLHTLHPRPRPPRHAYHTSNDRHATTRQRNNYPLTRNPRIKPITSNTATPILIRVQ